MDNAEYAKLIARNLKYYMALNGKTQADLSRDLGISKTSISSWMNGHRIPKVSTIDLFCSYFKIRRSDLMEEKPHGDTLSITLEVRRDEVDLIEKWRNASPAIKEAVKKLLD